MELERLIRGRISGLSDELSAEDVPKGIKQYVYIEDQETIKVPTGDLVETTYKKCKSLILLKKELLGTSQVFQVEVYNMGDGYDKKTYYRILSMLKA